MNTATRAALSTHLRSLRDGERSHFREAFDLLWPALTSFARRCGLQDADADDVAQRALLRVFDRISDYNPALDGLTWAFALTFCEVRTLRRQRARRQELMVEPSAHFEIDRHDGYSVLEWRETIASLALGFEELSQSDRDIVLAMLDDLDGRHPADAAKRKRRQRALDRLRVLVGRLYSFD